MTTAATSGSSSAGFLPASLAALLSRPIDDAAAAPAPPVGTLSVGSIFSAPTYVPPPRPLAAATSDALTVPLAPALPIVSAAGAPSVPSMAAASAPLLGAPALAPSPAAPMAPPLGAPAWSPPPPPAPAAYVAPAAVAASPAAYTPPAVFTPGSLPAPFHFGHLITTKLSSDNYVF